MKLQHTLEITICLYIIIIYIALVQLQQLHMFLYKVLVFALVGCNTVQYSWLLSPLQLYVS